MFLVISNVANDAAQHLVDGFPPGAAALVTASDLHWSFRAAVRLDDFARARLTVGGAKMSTADIGGVVTTIAYFLPQEFYYVEPADREYVCAETTAFFIYFLSQLACRVLNPPTTKTLCGLGMHRIEWMRAARDLSIPLLPLRLTNGVVQSTPFNQQQQSAEKCQPQRVRATSIAGTLVEDDDVRNAEFVVPGIVRERTLALSAGFRMPYLRADFVYSDGDYLLAEVSTVPDVRISANRDAIARYLTALP